MSHFKDVLTQAKANQKLRITAAEHEALVKLINYVNTYFTDEINENPEADTWKLCLQVDLHFDIRLVKALEVLSSDYPEVKFDLLTPHVLIFSLDRSDLEDSDPESTATALTKYILTSINDFGFVELHACTSTMLERFQSIAEKHSLNLAQVDVTCIFLTRKVTHAN